jgi:lipopolysaccharide export system protein LptC
MKNSSLIAYLIAFTLVAIASIIILKHNEKSSLISTHNGMNSYVTNIVITDFSKDGQISSTLQAATVQHEEMSGKTFLTKPFFTGISQKNDSHWHIHATTGVINESGTEVTLTGKVIVHELPSPHNVETTITTTLLTIYPKQSRAKTDQAVVLKRPGTTITGVGFTANLKTGEYQLRSGTEAIVAPQTERAKK